ncbi:TetR family transcriptional regulator [Croceicoccus sp. BE223]|uniref:TetR/AcrR family transcriptional regulator n=1 Tax=Croceicoccus sp. BE223 TaxID=2817716 RepID=UPI00286A7948|nr:TetR family transcriptional regulator [Croceicoccus sp. BE223]
MPRQPISEPESATELVDHAKAKLLATAEALFARQSIDSVSLREIAQRAGHRNVAAVQYHFGDRLGLLHALFEWRVIQMEAPRGRMLAELDANGMSDDLGGLLRAICEPILDLVDDEGVHTYAAFMCQYLTQLRPSGILHAYDLQPVRTANLHLLQERVLGIIGGNDIIDGDQRLGLAYLMVMNAIVFADTEKLPIKDPARFRARFDEAVRMAAAALAASMD